MQKNNFEPRCMAAGIGSLPYKDARISFAKIKKFLPEMPFWPQLPKRSYLEGMNIQFVEKFACLEVDKEKKEVFYCVRKDKDKEVQFTEFYEKILKLDFEYFNISREYAEGLYVLLDELEKGGMEEADFIKGQVTGPFTFAAGIKGENDKSILFDPMMFDMAVNGLSMKALWQIEQFKKFKKKPVIFFDEPYLSCLGSAFTALKNEEVSKRLLELLNPLKQAGALIGIHCCGNTDWPLFLNSMADIVNFDAWSYFEKIAIYPREIKNFLEKGGILAFGIVPTQDIPEDLTVNMVVEKIKGQFSVLEEKGIDKKLLYKKCLITPSCGLGLAREETADKMLEILNKVSLSLKEEFF